MFKSSRQVAFMWCHLSTDTNHQLLSQALFTSWCHNPVAVFSLRLLAQSYSLSCQLISKLYHLSTPAYGLNPLTTHHSFPWVSLTSLVCTADIDASAGFLMQVDKLVQLLESPIFIHMRLQLLEIQTDYHSDLVKSLYGLLMLLPQSAAFRILRDRLASVTNMATAIGRIHLSPPPPPAAAAAVETDESSNDAEGKPRSGKKQSKGGAARTQVDKTSLLAHFDKVQQRHFEARKQGMCCVWIRSMYLCSLLRCLLVAVLNDKSLLREL